MMWIPPAASELGLTFTNKVGRINRLQNDDDDDEYV